MKNFLWDKEWSPKLEVVDYNRNSEYEADAQEFAQKHGIKLYVLARTRDYYFPDDDRMRTIYKMQLVRDDKSYTFTFGQSIADGNKIPTYYDVFAAMTKSDPGTFHDFCMDYGCDEFKKKSYETYKAVKREYAAMERLFGDVMDEFSEIN